jgi:hypothetical protein
MLTAAAKISAMARATAGYGDAARPATGRFALRSG